MFHLPFIAMARESVATYGEVLAFVPIAYCIESAGTYMPVYMMHINCLQIHIMYNMYIWYLVIFCSF